jgi:hypothetical protein
VTIHRAIRSTGRFWGTGSSPGNAPRSDSDVTILARHFHELIGLKIDMADLGGSVYRYGLFRRTEGCVEDSLSLREVPVDLDKAPTGKCGQYISRASFHLWQGIPSMVRRITTRVILHPLRLPMSQIAKNAKAIRSTG